LRNDTGGVGLPPGYDYACKSPSLPLPPFSIFPSSHTIETKKGENADRNKVPQEHCKIHVFKTKNPPWQANTILHSWDQQNHVRLYVPVNVTIKELMQGLGCNNEDAKKNVLHEITEGGGGRWYKGMTITVSPLSLVAFPFFLFRSRLPGRVLTGL
jgi:hypothetical protein